MSLQEHESMELLFYLESPLKSADHHCKKNVDD